MANVTEPTVGGQYTSGDLVARAHAEGLAATERLIRDWVQLGLMPAPTRHGLGRGAGSVAYWDDNGHETLLLLLRQRRDNRSSIRALCNVPVGLWLYFGEPYATIPQVRRALATWAVGTKASSRVRAAAAARRVVADVAHRAAKPRDRRALESLLTRLQQDQDVGPYELRRLVFGVVDPLGEGARGPAGAPLSAEAYLTNLRAMTSALDALPKVSDAQLKEARIFARRASESYRAEYERFAADPEAGHLFAAPTLQEVLNSACRHFMRTLGLLLLQEERARLRQRRR